MDSTSNLLSQCDNRVLVKLFKECVYKIQQKSAFCVIMTYQQTILSDLLSRFKAQVAAALECRGLNYSILRIRIIYTKYNVV